MSSEDKNTLLQVVHDYYDQKFSEHGATPKGVDWNGEHSQTVRFKQFLEMFPGNSRFSINDLGCGYGALYDFLTVNQRQFDYYGYDLVERMVQHAQSIYKKNNCHFSVASRISGLADYSVASGIFNVKNSTSNEDWYRFILSTLQHMNDMSSRGFAFNALTVYSDKACMRDYLYYCDPLQVADYCCRNFSRSFELRHGYGLYEFTIIVNKMGIASYS